MRRMVAFLLLALRHPLHEVWLVECPLNAKFAGLTPSCCLPYGTISSPLLALRHLLVPFIGLTAPFTIVVGLTASVCCWLDSTPLLMALRLPISMLELFSPTTADDALLRRHQNYGWRLHVAFWVSNWSFLDNPVKPRSVSRTAVSNQPGRDPRLIREGTIIW